MLRLLRQSLGILALILGLAVCAFGQDTHIVFSGTSAVIVPSSPFNAFATASKVFIIAVPPNDSLTLYISNQGVATHNLTVTTNYTGFSFVADFTNNQAFWAPLNSETLPNGVLGNVQALSINATTTSVLGTAIVSGAQVAIKLSAGSASTDVFSITAILTPNGILGVGSVQGVAANSTSAAGIRPVLVAGWQTGTNTIEAISTDANGSITNAFQQVAISNIHSQQALVYEGAGPSNATAPLGVTILPVVNIFHNITTNTTTLLSSGKQFISAQINTAGSAATIAFWDSNTNPCSTGGTLIGTASANAQATLNYNVRLSLGLCVVTAGTTAGDYTVVDQE